MNNDDAQFIQDGADLRRVGVDVDETVNVLAGGRFGQTVSYHSAVAQREGKLWGCAMCWFLNWAVERDHCAYQFTDRPTPLLAVLRAGLCFGLAFMGLGLAIWWGVRAALGAYGL